MSLRSRSAAPTTKRQCIVKVGGKRCTKNALPGRRTCGGHNAKRNYSPKIKTRPIHLDATIRTLEADAPINTTPIVVTPLPEETPYIADVSVRDNGSIIGLPTTRPAFQRFLADWLTRPGRSLADIEILTPPTIQGRDISIAICDAAARMVKFDLGVRA